MGFDQMYTPWRLKYIEGEKEQGCLFCRVWEESDKDEENFVLWRGGGMLIMLNRYPYNSGHLMAAPQRHVARLEDLSPGERTGLMEATVKAEKALFGAYRPEGMNIGLNIGACAGAGVVGHVHMHLVPRWAGDTSAMAVIGETKVLPETLEETYRRVAARLKEDPGDGD
jgi:ATP adenylyltransferase